MITCVALENQYYQCNTPLRPKTDGVSYVVLLNGLGISCHHVVHEVSPKVGI